MNERTKQQIRQCTLITALLLFSRAGFASGHQLDGLGYFLWIIALGALCTWGTGFLALIFAFKYSKSRSRNYQVAAWVCNIISLGVILFFAQSILFKDNRNAYNNDGDEYILTALMIPLAVVVASIFMLVTKPDEAALPDELSHTDETAPPNTELNKLPGKWINAFKVFVFVVYAYKIITTLAFLCMLSGGRFSISFMHNNGTHNVNMHSNIFLTLQSFLGFVSLLYSPAIIYFMIKRSKWCWVLLCADSVFGAVGLLLGLFTFSFNHASQYTIIIEVALLFFVWLDEVADYLNITRPEKTKYAIAIAVVGLVLVVAKIAGSF